MTSALSKAIAHLAVGIAQLPERLIGLAINRVMIGKGLQAIGGGRKAALFVIERADAILAFGNRLLNIAQQLPHLRRKLGVGELREHLLAFLFGAHSLVDVPIRLLHLLVMDHADLFLALGRLFHRRVEQNEVLVLGFGLRHTV